MCNFEAGEECLWTQEKDLDDFGLYLIYMKVFFLISTIFFQILLLIKDAICILNFRLNTAKYALIKDL